MASKRICVGCEKPYTRTKNRHFGRFYCSDRCLLRVSKVPVSTIYERDEGICHLCDNHVLREQASRDHVVPRSLGGRTNFDNIKLAHKSCNNRRGSMPVSVFRAVYAT